jgi:diketogulonate reductase-like aldo/keto reductase
MSNLSSPNLLPTPFFLYGTAWKEDQTTHLTQTAIQAGFRAIDTANQRKHYFEKAVGQGLLNAYQDLGLTREDLWLQTKFTHLAGQDDRLPYDPQSSMYDQVMSSFTSSLDHLHTEYLDSYVLHGPSVRSGFANQDWEVWEAMETLHKKGQVRSLGISNVSASQLRLLLKESIIKPKFVQNRCFAHHQWDQEVRQICKEHMIIYQGFSLLTANRPVWESEGVNQLAQKYTCSAAEIIFSLALELNMLPLTGTSNATHMNMDLKSRKGMLNAQEIYALEHIYS